MLGWAGTYEDNMVIFRYARNPGGQRLLFLLAYIWSYKIISQLKTKDINSHGRKLGAANIQKRQGKTYHDKYAVPMNS